MTLVRGQGAIVVDASAAIRFLEGDVEWLARWREWEAADDVRLVPPHFPAEVANGLLKGGATRSANDVTTLMRWLNAAGFEIADRGLHGIEGAIRLADRHRLTVYDAAYLDLAIDVDAELATEDRALRKAAEAEGVPLAA